MKAQSKRVAWEIEERCERLFQEAGPFWHLYTREDQPVFLPDEDSFRLAMNSTAICLKLHPEIRTLTFEWMSNHHHGLYAAKREAQVTDFFEDLTDMLRRSLRQNGRPADLSGLNPRPREITSLSDLRNVLVYANRNGYLVSPDHTPFSYPWGANKYYFNPEAKQRFHDSSRPVGARERRALAHSRRADALFDLRILDGCISPMCFCDIPLGEAFFHNAHQYFAHLSRNVESYKAIACEIGESIFYTDEELFSLTGSLSAKQFDQKNPTLLPNDAKIGLAKTLRFEYNASNKQIARLLRLSRQVVDALFPNR